MIDIHAPNITGRLVVVTRPDGSTITGKIEAVRGDHVHVMVRGFTGRIAAEARQLSWPPTETIPPRRAME
jgi:hypothetical protein